MHWVPLVRKPCPARDCGGIHDGTDMALTVLWVPGQLIYGIETDVLVLTFTRTGNHSDLFGKKAICSFLWCTPFHYRLCCRLVRGKSRGQVASFWWCWLHEKHGYAGCLVGKWSVNNEAVFICYYGNYLSYIPHKRYLGRFLAWRWGRSPISPVLAELHF